MRAGAVVEAEAVEAEAEAAAVGHLAVAVEAVAAAGVAVDQQPQSQRPEGMAQMEASRVIHPPCSMETEERPILEGISHLPSNESQ
jgi:hypothetical protein